MAIDRNFTQKEVVQALIEDEKRQDWYFTFGSDHAHPYGFVCIFGTFMEARTEMQRRYGQKWSFQYTYKEFAGQVEKYGLREVN